MALSEAQKRILDELLNRSAGTTTWGAYGALPDKTGATTRNVGNYLRIHGTKYRRRGGKIVWRAIRKQPGGKEWGTFASHSAEKFN